MTETGKGRRLAGETSQPPGRVQTRGSGLARYAFAWLAVAVIIVVAIGALIGALRGEEEVPLPPVRAVQLDDAANRAGCQLRSARRGEQLNPPVDGPRLTERVRTGVYDRPLAPATLGGAVRQGLVVIHHRPDLAREVLDDLAELQRAVPAGTIVSVNAALGSRQVVVTAYRRQLACPRYNREAIDAIRLFRGRFIGSGPDG